MVAASPHDGWDEIQEADGRSGAMNKTARARWMVVAVLAVAGLSVGFISLAWSNSVALASSEGELGPKPVSSMVSNTP